MGSINCCSYRDKNNSDLLNKNCDTCNNFKKVEKIGKIDGVSYYFCSDKCWIKWFQNIKINTIDKNF